MARRHFDKEYDCRIADWGGGYPRPFREILDKSWKADLYRENKVVVISEDPHLSSKALEDANGLKQEIMDKRSKRKERKRRDKIEKVY